jgi:flagellar assembly protein FliH
MSSNPTAPGNGGRKTAELFVFDAPKGENGRRLGGDIGWQVSVADPHAEQKGYEKGLVEGEARARVAFEKSAADLRGGLSEALRQFVVEREKYFQRVEGEIVQLALSIARKILHREAQIDPLLLAGIVRVALDSLNEGTHVRLRTKPQEVLFWRDYFIQATDIAPSPEVIGDDSLDAGCCVIETDLGSTRISMETQLKEIEQGFLDLLDHRPRVRE